MMLIKSNSFSFSQTVDRRAGWFNRKHVPSKASARRSFDNGYDNRLAFAMQNYAFRFRNCEVWWYFRSVVVLNLKNAETFGSRVEFDQAESPLLPNE